MLASVRGGRAAKLLSKSFLLSSVPPSFSLSISSHQVDQFLCKWEPENLENLELSHGFFLITDIAQEKMEPDSGQLPSSTTTECKILMGSSSAPMINVLG